MQPPPNYAPGQVLPGTVYRVVRHLATGGMGSVYDVEDVTVEKRYVLKTLHPQLISREDLARRMRDEAKALAKLHHPNIVDVITAGVTSDSVKMPFYVMERLNGQNLRVVLEKKSALDVSHSYRIAIDVADALEHAHENNIIHRDVKPENIFLHRNSNGTTTTKLLDFGIVRLLDRKASHTHGKFIGTLRYASPEQITGAALGVGTDIYSLGVVLFEMLAGCGPFDNAGDAYAIGAAHANQIPPPISHFARVSPQVERLVASALAKNPEQRPRDCFAFASELRRLLREEEAAPRSATMANVLSAAVPPTHAVPAGTGHTGMEHMNTAAAMSSGMTMQGMIPPSTVPVTRREGGLEDDGGPVSPIAPTLAVDAPLAGAHGAHGAHGAYSPNVQVNVAQPPVAGGGGQRVIDRSAPTRESAPIGWTQRLAPNDTRIEDGQQPVAAFGAQAPVGQGQSYATPGHGGGAGGGPSDDAVRAAFGEETPLIIRDSDAGAPPMGGMHGHQPHHSSSPDNIVFPPNHGRGGQAGMGTNPTGPLSGEASTRPPEKGPFILLAIAATFSIVAVAGVLAFVHFRKSAGAAGPTPTLATQAPPSMQRATTAAPTTTASLDNNTENPAAPVTSTSTAASGAGLPASTSSASAQPSNVAAASAPTTIRTVPGARTAQPPHHGSGPKTTPSGHAPDVKWDP